MDGKNGTVSDEWKTFLDYVAGKWSEDVFVKKLNEAVEKAKRNQEWRHEYIWMKLNRFYLWF